MAEFEVGINIQPEPGTAKRFETEAKAVATSVEPIIQKAFSISQAQAKKMLAPFEAEIKRIASKAIKLDVVVNKASVSKAAAETKATLAKAGKIDIAVNQASASRAARDTKALFTPIVQKVQVASAKGVKGPTGALVPKVDSTIAPGIDKITSSLGRLNASSQVSAQSILKFAAGFVGAAGAVGGFIGLVTTAVSSGTQLDTQLRALDNLTGVLGATASESFKKIQLEANKLPGTFSDVQTGVIQLSSVLGFNLNQSLKAFEDLTGAALASGKGLANVNGAIAQLGQISAKGRLQMEELSTIAENIPGIKVADVISKIAIATGKTVEETRKALTAGGIDSAKAIKAILDVAKDVPGAQEAIKNSANSLEAVFSSLSDALKVGLGKAFLEAVNSAGGAQATFGQLSNVVGQLTAKLVPLFTTFVQLTPAFGASLQIVNALVTPLNAVAKIFSALGPAITPVVTGLVAFRLFKTIFVGLNSAVASFQGFLERTSASTAIAKAGLESQGKSAGFLRTAMSQVTASVTGYGNAAIAAASKAETLTVAMGEQAISAEAAAAANGTAAVEGAAAATAAEGAATSAAGVGSTIAAAAGPIGLVLGAAAIAWQVQSQASQKAKENAQKYIDVVTKGIPTDVNNTADIDARIAAYKTEAELADKRAQHAKSTGGFFEFAFHGKEKQHDEEKKFFAEAEDDAKNERDFLTGFAKDTGLTMAEAATAAAQQGIDFTVLDDIMAEKGKAGVAAYLQAAEQAWRDSGAVTKTTQAANDALSDAFSTLDSLTSASKAVTSANKALTSSQTDEKDAIAKVNELYAKKKKLLADTTSEAKELAGANRDVAKSEITLRELLEEQQQLPKDLAELEDKKTLASIKYTQAVRDQEAAVKKLNGEGKKGLSVNLAGLNQAQIKTALANARLAGTENDNKVSDADAKAQLEEDVVTKTIAVRDAKRDQDGIETSIRDKNERISDITGDIQEAEGKITEEKTKRDAIANGETQHAKDLREVDLDIVTAALASAGATERRRDAEITARDAAWDYEKAIATAADDHTRLLGILQEEANVAPPGVQAAVKPKIETAKTNVGAETTQQTNTPPPKTPEQLRLENLATEREDKRSKAIAQLQEEKSTTDAVGNIVPASQQVIDQFLNRGGLTSLQGVLDATLITTLNNQDVNISKKFDERFKQQQLVGDYLEKNFGATDEQVFALLNDETFSKEVLSQVTSSALKDRTGDVRNAIRDILKRLNINLRVPGFKGGGLVGLDSNLKGGQLVVAGEGGKEELILPLRGTKERALELLAQAAKVSNPAIAAILQRAIGGKVPGFRRGGIVGGHAAEGGVVTGVPAKGDPLAPVGDKIDAVGSEVTDGFDTVDTSLESQDEQIKTLFRISRGLTRALVDQQAHLVDLSNTLGQQQTKLIALDNTVGDLGAAIDKVIPILTEVIPQEFEQIASNNENLAGSVGKVFDIVQSIAGSVGTLAGAVNTVAGAVSLPSKAISDLAGAISSLSGAVASNTTILAGTDGKGGINGLLLGITNILVGDGTHGMNAIVNGTFLKLAHVEPTIIAIAKKLGITPAAAEGAVITGTPGAFGQLVRVGEHNRPEAIVPLRSKENMLNVLRNSMPYAAPGVRGVLDGLFQDEAMGHAGASLDLSSSSSSVSVTGGVSSSKRDQTEMAMAVGNVIADRLIAAGVGNNGGDVHIQLQGSDYNEINAKKLVREIERKRNRF